MKYVVAVFGSCREAEGATRAFRSRGISKERFTSLTPKASERELAAVPTMAAEQPGVGKALGAVVGGALGLAGGLGIGAILQDMRLLGIGPAFAAGLAVVVLLGIGGTLGGMAVGSALDDALSEGLPMDEWFIYQSALRQGRSVLIAAAADNAEADAFGALLAERGAETIDAARKQWSVGLRSAEEEHYTAVQRPSGLSRHGKIEAKSTNRSGHSDEPAGRRRVA